MSFYNRKTATLLGLLGAVVSAALMAACLAAVGFLNGSKIWLLPLVALGLFKGLKNKTLSTATQLAQLAESDRAWPQDARRLTCDALAAVGHTAVRRKFIALSGLWDVLAGYAAGGLLTLLVVYIARNSR